MKVTIAFALLAAVLASPALAASWPLVPLDSVHPLGNNWGNYQDYGGGPYFHNGGAATLQQGGLFAPISREGSLVLNNILLTACCATVLVGTLYPLVLEATTGGKISVGAPFFNLTFGPLLVAMDSHGGSLYREVQRDAAARRAEVLASLGVKP